MEKTALKSILRLYGKEKGLETKDPSELHIKGVFDFDKLLETAEPIKIKELEHKWEIPTPMENIKPTIPFPISSFPKIIQDYIEAIAEHTQTPIDMSAVSVMCVVATAIQGKIEIEGKKDYIETSNLYCMIVARSGERKTPVQKITTKPLYAYEKEENKKRQAIIDKQRLELFTKQKKLEKLTKIPEKLEEAIALQAEIRELEEKQIKPITLIVDNCTLEALTSLLSDNDGKISLISAEGGIFDILNGQYNNSKSPASIDTFLKAYCGEKIRVDRKGRESEEIDSPTMTVLLAVQDIVLERLMENDTFKGKGLNARFLYCNPVSTIGTRKYRTKEIPTTVEKEYHELIYELLELPKKETPILLKPSIDADNELEKFHYWIEVQLKDELEFMGDWAGKLFGSCLRIAGILHCIKYSSIATDYMISLDTIKKAIDISKYFLEHAKYAYMLMGADKETQKAKYILKKLEKQDKMSLKRNEIFSISRSPSRNINKVDDIFKALDILVEYGYILELEAEERAGAGRKKDIVYELNPLYFKDKSK